MSGEIDQLQAEARVRLVGAEAVHRLAVGHAREGRGDLDAVGLAEDAREQALDERLDFLLGDEGSLEVDLREFRLPVGAQVFVAEAAGDLEIFLEAGDLQELLVLLRRLRERVKRCPGFSRDGTRKSRAPSGVGLERMGVSISR